MNKAVRHRDVCLPPGAAQPRGKGQLGSPPQEAMEPSSDRGLLANGQADRNLPLLLRVLSSPPGTLGPVCRLSVSSHPGGRRQTPANSPPGQLLCGSLSLHGNRGSLTHRFHTSPSGAKLCSATSPGHLTCQPQLSQGTHSSRPLGRGQAAEGPESLPSQAPLG